MDILYRSLTLTPGQPFNCKIIWLPRLQAWISNLRIKFEVIPNFFLAVHVAQKKIKWACSGVDYE